MRITLRKYPDDHEVEIDPDCIEAIVPLAAGPGHPARTRIDMKHHGRFHLVMDSLSTIRTLQGYVFGLTPAITSDMLAVCQALKFAKDGTVELARARSRAEDVLDLIGRPTAKGGPRG